ncbi:MULTISPECIES: hypothetical protein [unclassified Microcoleus]
MYVGYFSIEKGRSPFALCYFDYNILNVRSRRSHGKSEKSIVVLQD